MVAEASSQLFQVLGVRPFLGRMFTPERRTWLRQWRKIGKIGAQIPQKRF